MMAIEYANTTVGTPTVVVFGLGSHPVLGEIYQQLQSRGRRRVVFVPLESYPTGTTFSLHQAGGSQHGEFRLDGEEPVAFGDIVSVCLDGYYIVAGGEELSQEDQQYRQAESWAALVALFHCLSERCLVANHVVDRDHFHSRLSELYLLHSYALPVPRTLVTSDAASARRFIQEVGTVIYRPVMGKDLPFQPIQPQDLERLDEVSLAPVHFEEHSEGELAGCLRVGSQTFVSPREAEVPAEIQAGFAELCEDLGLQLAEMRMRKSADGAWQATSLHPFLTLEGLSDGEVFQAALQLLEMGKAES